MVSDILNTDIMILFKFLQVYRTGGSSSVHPLLFNSILNYIRKPKKLKYKYNIIIDNLSYEYQNFVYFCVNFFIKRLNVDQVNAKGVLIRTPFATACVQTCRSQLGHEVDRGWHLLVLLMDFLDQQCFNTPRIAFVQHNNFFKDKLVMVAN